MKKKKKSKFGQPISILLTPQQRQWIASRSNGESIASYVRRLVQTQMETTGK